MKSEDLSKAKKFRIALFDLISKAMDDEISSEEIIGTLEAAKHQSANIFFETTNMNKREMIEGYR